MLLIGFTEPGRGINRESWMINGLCKPEGAGDPDGFPFYALVRAVALFPTGKQQHGDLLIIVRHFCQIPLVALVLILAVSDQAQQVLVIAGTFLFQCCIEVLCFCQLGDLAGNMLAFTGIHRDLLSIS